MDLHRREDLRSPALHEAAVRVLQAHPESAERALQVLDHWDTVADPASKPLRDEWRRIIENKLWVLALEDSDRGQLLRQASPWASSWAQRRGTPSLSGTDDARVALLTA